MLIGRNRELSEFNNMYKQDRFQLFVLYGRRRVGKTTLLNEFCKGKNYIFYSAEQSNKKTNLRKFSELVFQHYGETALEPFSSWSNALSYINQRQGKEKLLVIFDEFPYLVKKDKAILSEFQHLIDHELQYGNLFIVLCGSYMSFMEKEILGSKSPIFGRRTGQLQLKPLDFFESIKFMEGISNEDKVKLFGAFGGTPLYLNQINADKSFEENIKDNFLRPTAYLYEEPLLLLRQEVNEPGIYNAIIEAIAGGATKVNEIATKIGEETAKCLKYINVLCNLGILYKEAPFGEKESSRKTIYNISDLMFRFWYRYTFGNRSLIETGAEDIVWQRKIGSEYNSYLGFVFERICRDYLSRMNINGDLPILYSSIGRWWGNDPIAHKQVEIDIIAKDGDDYLFCECKWKNELVSSGEITKLINSADVFSKNRRGSWFIFFSKSGFTNEAKAKAKEDSRIALVTIDDMLESYNQ